MPKKKTVLTEAERRKRIRETARALETSDDPKDFERAFKIVASSRGSRNKSDAET
jgi:hypothetical protein